LKNTSGLKPLGASVLLKPYEVETVTKGGIVLPGQVRERDQLAEQRAVVVEIGPVAWDDEPARAKIGDKILFSKHAGYVAVGTADGQKYRIVNARDIFCQITEEKDDADAGGKGDFKEEYKLRESF